MLQKRVAESKHILSCVEYFTKAVIKISGSLIYSSDITTNFWEKWNNFETNNILPANNSNHHIYIEDSLYNCYSC